VTPQYDERRTLMHRTTRSIWSIPFHLLFHQPASSTLSDP